MEEGTSNSSELLLRDADPEQLAEILGTSYRKIKYFYYSRSISSHYNRFEIPKKGGGTRVILAPSNKLKTLQRRIAKQLDKIYKPKAVAKAFIRGESIVSNASPHASKRFVFNLDLQDFFSSITFARVRGLLIAEPYSLTPEASTVIAHLCTVNGILPQGAPTSPIISNMICSSLDRELSLLARKHRANYTRYADDISFSFYCPIRYLPAQIVLPSLRDGVANTYSSRVGQDLTQIIERNGFKINERKVRLQSLHERQVVTGLTVNEFANVDRRFVRRVSAIIHSIESLGKEEAGKQYKLKFPNSKGGIESYVQGGLLFIKQVKGVESEVYLRLARRFNALTEEFRVPLSVRRKSKTWIGEKRELVKKCWIIEFEEGLSQGSGFMLGEKLIVTCAHVLKADIAYATSCEVFRADSRSERYTANVVHVDASRDLALLTISQDSEGFDFFELDGEEELEVGERVAVLGFPNDKAGSTDVTRFSAAVISTYKLFDSVLFYEVDKVLYPGNSGGPVLNSSLQVVGVAAKGASDGGGYNAFIGVAELKQVLEDYELNTFNLV